MRHRTGAPRAHLDGGMDLVRRTLEEARGAARSQGKDVGRGRSSPARRVGRQRGRRRRWSGPGPTLRDPQTARRRRRGTSPAAGADPLAGGRGFGVRAVAGGGRRADRRDTRRRPRLDEGVLTVSARIDGVGHPAADGAGPAAGQDRARRSGTASVTSLKIVGPIAPSWRKGRFTSPAAAPATPTADTSLAAAESR